MHERRYGSTYDRRGIIYLSGLTLVATQGDPVKLTEAWKMAELRAAVCPIRGDAWHLTNGTDCQRLCQRDTHV